MIGIVGGVGPFAGVDLLKKIFDNTLAENDQECQDVAKNGEQLFSIGRKGQERVKISV